MHSWNNYIVNYHLMQFFFLFIGREATTWPANNCLQIVVCSCTVSPNCVWLQIILCWWCVNAIALAWKWQITNLFMYQRYSLRKQTHDRMIKTIIIINSVIAKYSDLSVSYRSINILSQTLASSTNHNILLNLIQLLNIGQRKISQKNQISCQVLLKWRGSTEGVPFFYPKT